MHQALISSWIYTPSYAAVVALLYIKGPCISFFQSVQPMRKKSELKPRWTCFGTSFLFCNHHCIARLPHRVNVASWSMMTRLSAWRYTRAGCGPLFLPPNHRWYFTVLKSMVKSPLHYPVALMHDQPKKFMLRGGHIFQSVLHRAAWMFR